MLGYISYIGKWSVKNKLVRIEMGSSQDSFFASIFLRDSQDCMIAAACGQFRTRDCLRVTIHLLCQTQPIIEASAKMKFLCLQSNYNGMEGNLLSVYLFIYENS